jgi:hypothetical protein
MGMAASFRVVKSFENEASDRCVDIFQRHDGSFGFEECRRDQEDATQWFPLDKYSRLVFATEAAALAEATARVVWLAPDKP